MDEQASPLERDHFLSVVLPGGREKNATVHGSKPVMDLLVTLCASHHLNPSDYTVEVLSPNKNNISFKPNSPIGSLEADTIVLKPKGVEENIRRPYMPEATVRLLINYNQSHKAVVRVNPRVPLEVLLPVVCDKCEFRVETTVLLRDSQSREPLDLTETLNGLGLREVFAKDTAGKETADHQHQPRTPEAAVTPTEVVSPPPPQELPKKEKKQKDNTGFLSLFRRQKKKGEARVPASPGRDVHVGVGGSSSNTLPADVPKKRRAPQPPMGASQSVPNDLGTCHVGGSQRSAESTLRRTKRRAPAPPRANAHQEVKGTLDSLNAADELRESDESDSVNLSLSSSSSSPQPSHHPQPSSRPSFAHRHEMTLPSFRGKDLSDARSALAKVLTSSVSRGTLVQRLRNSASFPKFYSGSSFVTQRCSDNGLFCAELEPVQRSKLPTEHEAPVQRKGMTTFKVVPSNTPKSVDPELPPDPVMGEDDPEREAPLEAERNPTEADPRSPDGSGTQTPLQSPEPSSLETPPSPSPPLDLDHRESPGSPVSEVGDTIEEQTEEDEPEVPSEVTPAVCSDEEPTGEGQEGQTERQSPGGLSVSPDVDRCGPYTEETEAEEEVGQEEEEEDCFPPPPPPIFFDEEEEDVEEEEEEDVEEEEEEEEEVVVVEEVKAEEDVEDVKEEEEEEEEEEEVVVVVEEVKEEEDGEDKAASSPSSSSPPSSQPPSPTSNGQSHAFSADSQPTSATPTQPATAPKPLDRMSAAPSRFAQAVALGVQRSRLQSGEKGLGPPAVHAVLFPHHPGPHTNTVPDWL